MEHDYEYYLSDTYFDEKYGLKSKKVISRAAKKDKIALAIFEQYGYHLGDLIKTLLFAYDPEMIVIGGSLSKSFPFFEKYMWKRINSFQYPHLAKKIKVKETEQENIAVMGAAALYFDAHNQKLIK